MKLPLARFPVFPSSRLSRLLGRGNPSHIPSSRSGCPNPRPTPQRGYQRDITTPCGTTHYSATDVTIGEP